MRWFRRETKPVRQPLPAEPLRLDLYKYLVDELYDAPPHVRRNSRWVMNTEWLNECRQLGERLSPHPLPVSDPVTLLGLPIEVRDDGGVPHLELRHDISHGAGDTHVERSRDGA